MPRAGVMSDWLGVSWGDVRTIKLAQRAHQSLWEFNVNFFEGSFGVTEVGACRAFGGKLLQPLDLGSSWPSMSPI